MRGLMERVFARLHAGESISDRLRLSFMILMGLLIVPALRPSSRLISLIPFPSAESFSILSRSFMLRCW